ncbi:MAG: NAD(P)H-dependent oxidoreductase [Myxococcales bacterium]|nr:NAD(P)H-dependent oxidoreductase [Myxococcales bacterium]MCB9714440.1 NAD(P)H-dependent oxidoreductase [Myxococcales bacterium]
MKILGIPGSLRRASINRALLVSARALAPAGVELVIDDLRPIPMYDPDLDDPAALAPVEAFKQRIAEADALLIATPEYNYGIPGVLKNAIDWASRPAYRSVFAGKPCAIVSASPSLMGGVRAQGQLKQVLLGMAAEVFPHPEFAVTQAGHKLHDGELGDEPTREHLAALLVALRAWVQRRQAGPSQSEPGL